MMQINSNIIVVTRQDLSIGYQNVQSIHSILEFFNDYPDIYQNWFKTSKALTVLAVPNEVSLKILISKLAAAKIRFSIFIEPDIDNQITAVAIEPSVEAKKLCSNIPLALREYNNSDSLNKNNYKTQVA